jgi:hypothetical protein
LGRGWLVALEGEDGREREMRGVEKANGKWKRWIWQTYSVSNRYFLPGVFEACLMLAHSHQDKGKERDGAAEFGTSIRQDMAGGKRIGRYE